MHGSLLRYQMDWTEASQPRRLWEGREAREAGSEGGSKAARADANLPLCLQEKLEIGVFDFFFREPVHRLPKGDVC